MTLRLDDAQLDRFAPFGILCDLDGTILRTGPSLARLRPDLAGSSLLDVVEVVRPLGLASMTEVRAIGASVLVLRLRPFDLSFRFQVVETEEPVGVLLVGAPVVTTSDDLERRGLSAADFSPIDQTPDLLLLRRGQERSLRELRDVNVELSDTARELRTANRMLGHAEAQYRRLVELQPLVMYVDRLGESPTAEFVSPGAEAWLGHPLTRWTDEPGFFFSIVHPDDHDRVLQAHLDAEADDSPFDQEFRLRTADGRIVWTRAVDSVVRDEGDAVGRRIGFMLDVTVGKAAELALRETMSRFTTLLTHMQAGVLVEDAERRVVLVNDTLCGLFRSALRPDELAGLAVSVAVTTLASTADDADAFLSRTDDLLRRRWPAVGELLTLADGRVLEFDFQPIVEDGAGLGALWMFRDVTPRAQYEEALASARDEAIAASDAKSQFLASMSHEIRTPMHGVLATIDLLQTTALDAEQRELVDVVSGSAAALVAIINDILDLQKVEAGRIELASEAFAVRGAAQAVIDLLASQARSKGIDLTLRVDPDVPDHVVGDPLRLRQVLVNLVGNAVKFTASGSVAVHLGWSATATASGEVDVEVADTGPGIPAERLDDIFDPFVQVRSGQEGTGLGLAIADRLVGLMGGRLRVVSTWGEGTTFAFGLPVAVAAAAPVGAAEAGPPSADRIVLVVDPDEAGRDLLMKQLARLGVPSRAVGTLPDAVDALALAVPYGLVLLDVTSCGAALDRRALADVVPALRTGRVSVVGLAAGGSPADVGAGTDLGLDDLLPTPVDLAALRAVTERWLHVPRGAAADRPPASSAGQEVPRTAALHSRAEPEPEPEVGPAARVLLVDDNDVNRRLAAAMISRIGLDADVVDSAAAAITALTERVYGLVLMDVQMPDMDGRAATRAWRTSDGGATPPSVPVVALTAHVGQDERDACTAAGMDDYLSKPFGIDALAATCRRWLGPGQAGKGADR